ncbi:Chitin synthase, class 2 [Chytriomyces hyalinus]|nr:Chitin synthase, class 2 [Chytriomyces hyalinus]
MQQYQALPSQGSREQVASSSSSNADERSFVSVKHQPYSPSVPNHPYHSGMPESYLNQPRMAEMMSISEEVSPAPTPGRNPMAIGYQQIAPFQHFAKSDPDFIFQMPEKKGFQRSPFQRKPTKMVKKEVVLTDGNFVVDIPLGDEYLNNVYHRTDEEFTNLRYTAVTCDANYFGRQYNVRQSMIGRKTKLAVVCTMYNEDELLFTKTISAVMDNISYLCSLGKKGWNALAWKEIVVVIVADGVRPMNKQTLDVLSAMGCFVEGLPRSTVNEKPVEAHFFEFTTQARVDQELNIRFVGGDTQKHEIPVVPMQTIFVLKEKNAKKINSHRWFFNSICEKLKPEVCILLDVGTRPTRQSFYHLYRAFDRNKNVAGACGEIAAELGSMWKNLMNPLVAVQNFEYKMSNILDKPFESMCGYISVLPGAFSAYRYKALLGRPLECYFKGEKLHADGIVGRPNVSESNMYLAEDRILCFELVMKAHNQYVLKYVKSAKAETDVPTEMHDLIKQRRRWFNGSFFASTYAVQNFTRILTSGHYPHRKFILLLETFYNAINLAFSWFNIASMYICFFFMFNIADKRFADCTQAIVDTYGVDPFFPYGTAVSATLKAAYITAFITMVLVSLGNKPDTVKTLVIFISIIFALCMVLMLALVSWTMFLQVKGVPTSVHGFTDVARYIARVASFRDLAVSLMCTYALYVLSSLLYLDPWHTITCLLQYLLMIPTFTNVLMVYAFCNIHDISWGTKGQDSTSHAPAVKSKKNEKGEEVAATDVPAPSYINELEKLKNMSYLLRNPPQKEDAKPVDFTSEDHFKNYRTYVVVAWFLSNFLLVYILTNSTVISKMSRDNDPNYFLSFLLWSVAGLTAVRFAGSFLYWVCWVAERGLDMF